MTESHERAMTESHERAPHMTSFLVLWSGQAISLLGSMAVQFARSGG